MSRRELIALGVIANANNASTMSGTGGSSSTGTGTSNTGAVESFSLHPCSENINPSTVEGRKLYLAATKELNKEDRISMSIENGHKVKNHLETCDSKHSWGLLISKVPDTNGDQKDII